MLYAVLDIETNNDLDNINKIHCVGIQPFDLNNLEKEFKTDFYFDDGLKKLPHVLKNYKKIIMHNGISFDAPILNRLCGTTIKLSDVEDTLIMSQLFNPIREGGHSLKSWGERLSFNKQQVSEETFENGLTFELLDYCKRDVELTKKVFMELLKEGKSFSRRSVDLEYKTRSLIDKQIRHGFYLEERKASILLSSLEDEASIIEEE